MATKVTAAKRERLDGLSQSWFDEEFVNLVAHLGDVYNTSQRMVAAYE